LDRQDNQLFNLPASYSPPKKVYPDRPETETAWQNHDTGVATKCLLEGLTSGVKYWFCIAALNSHGYGPCSQPVAVWVK